MTMSTHYPPSHHLETDQAPLLRLVRILRLATLVSVNADSTADSPTSPADVSFIPMLVEGDGNDARLLGHLDANNPQARQLDGRRMQAIFHGPQGYISPDAYESAQLPTWNYVHVVVTGTVTELSDDTDKRNILLRMSETFGGKSQQFRLESNDARMSALLPAIRAFRMDIDSIVGRFKLSQDKSRIDAEGALQAMRQRSTDRDAKVYEWIRQEGMLPK